MRVNWLSQSLQQVPDDVHWLHPREQEVLEGFKFAKRRNDWLLGRWTAKQCVEAWLISKDSGVPLNELAIIAADDGAPEVFYKDKLLDRIISISHSHGVGLAAICNRTHIMGCDLEKIETRSPLFIEDYFTDKERSFILGNGEEHTSLLANLIWSAKESVVKALRVGLSIDTKLIEIHCSPTTNEGEWQHFDIRYPKVDHALHGKWQLLSGHVVTIVCDQEQFKPLVIRGNLQ